MKKISLFSLALVTSLAVFAQDNPPARTPQTVQTRFGLKGGVNLAEYNLSNKPSGSTMGVNMRPSFNAGAFVNIPIAGAFRIQPEVVFSGQGSKLTGVPSGSSSSTQIAYDETVHYINVPVMFQWQTDGGFFLETGPQAGFRMGAKDKIASGSASPNTEYDIKDKIKGFDFSWGAGLGYMHRIGLGVGARYNYGITNVYNTNNGNIGGASIGSTTAKNSVIQFSVLYAFGASK